MPRFTSERPSASVATTRPSFTPTLTPQPAPQNRQGAFDHLSFAANHADRKPGDVIVLKGIEQVLWPQHCLQGSEGAELAASLKKDRIVRIFHKGTDRTIDSYSTFFDNARRRSTGLDDFLREKGVTDLYLAGLATDYCVKFSALDAVRQGYTTHVVIDGCRGIDLTPGDIDRAVREMEEAGVRIVTSEKLDPIK
jgi:nicotinamidase/pyrazinamidase